MVEEALDFMVENCIWDANTGLGPKRVNFTAELMNKVGNIPQGKTPKYEDLVDLSFANEAIKELGEWKGPCPTDVRSSRQRAHGRSGRSSRAAG